jgi:hypothetical protein
MLTANRFDQIKTFVKSLHGKSISKIPDQHVREMAIMLAELAAEVERLLTPARGPGGNRSNIRPVVLDARGQPVLPPPVSHQLAADRREQYDIDRFEAIMHPNDLTHWIKFSLRWGLTPPPGGWENEDAMLHVIHGVRLGIRAVPHLEKHFSATWLTSRGHRLPQGVTLVNGVLSGTVSDS